MGRIKRWVVLLHYILKNYLLTNPSRKSDLVSDFGFLK